MTLVINPVVGCRYFPPGPWLLSQPKRSPRWPVPNYTAWWQRHTGVSSLAMAILYICSGISLLFLHCVTCRLQNKMVCFVLYQPVSTEVAISVSSFREAGDCWKGSCRFQSVVCSVGTPGLPGNIRLWNDLLCVELDVKPCTLTQPVRCYYEQHNILTMCFWIKFQLKVHWIVLNWVCHELPICSC